MTEDVLASDDELGRQGEAMWARTIRLGVPRRWLDRSRVVGWLAAVATVAAYAGFHVGTGVSRTPSAAVARPAASSPAVSAPSAPSSPTSARNDRVDVVESWTSGRRALLLGDLTDYCEHYAALGPGTLYADLAECERLELRAVGAARQHPLLTLRSAGSSLDPERVDLRADSVAVVWWHDVVGTDGVPAPQDGSDEFSVLRRQPSGDWLLVGEGQLHPYQERGYDGPGLPART